MEHRARRAGGVGALAGYKLAGRVVPEV